MRIVDRADGTAQSRSSSRERFGLAPFQRHRSCDRETVRGSFRLWAEQPQKVADRMRETAASGRGAAFRPRAHRPRVARGLRRSDQFASWSEAWHYDPWRTDAPSRAIPASQRLRKPRSSADRLTPSCASRAETLAWQRACSDRPASAGKSCWMRPPAFAAPIPSPARKALSCAASRLQRRRSIRRSSPVVAIAASVAASRSGPIRMCPARSPGVLGTPCAAR